jgi:hypothetical protein
MRPDLSGDGDLVADYPFFKRKGTATIREKKLQPPMFVLNVNERGCSFFSNRFFCLMGGLLLIGFTTLRCIGPKGVAPLIHST